MREVKPGSQWPRSVRTRNTKKDVKFLLTGRHSPGNALRSVAVCDEAGNREMSEASDTFEGLIK